MELLLAVWAACMSLGLSNGRTEDKMYGERHTFDIPSSAEYLSFRSTHASSNGMVRLWTRSKPEATIRGRPVNRNTGFVIEQLTQEDTGYYQFLNRNTSLARTTLIVNYNVKTFNPSVGDNLEFNYALPPKECSVFFTTSSNERLNIVRKGRVLYSRLDDRLTLDARICSVEIEQLQVEDSGTYEILDLRDNLALLVQVEVAEAMTTWMNVGLSAGILAAVVSCCCCVKRCCCKKSGSKSRGPDTGPDPVPTEGPATPLQQYTAEPGPPRYFVEPGPPANPGYAYAYQPGNPAAPSAEMYTPTPVLPYPIPAAPQAPAPGGGGAAPPNAGFGSNFLCSDADPYFEKKGLSFAPPLSLGNTSPHVYTSDKLNVNFL